MILIYIALGGAAGAVARYGLGLWVQDRTGFTLPWGTLAVNVLGCLLIGFAMRYPGALLEAGAWVRAGAYAFGSLVLGIAAVCCGMWLAGHLLPRPGM